MAGEKGKGKGKKPAKFAGKSRFEALRALDAPEDILTAEEDETEQAIRSSDDEDDIPEMAEPRRGRGSLDVEEEQEGPAKRRIKPIIEQFLQPSQFRLGMLIQIPISEPEFPLFNGKGRDIEEVVENIYYGWIFTKNRRCIVVGLYDAHFVALPLRTFDGKGSEEREQLNPASFVSLHDPRTIPRTRRIGPHKPLLAAQIYHPIRPFSALAQVDFRYPISRWYNSPNRWDGQLTSESLERLFDLWELNRPRPGMMRKEGIHHPSWSTDPDEAQPPEPIGVGSGIIPKDTETRHSSYLARKGRGFGSMTSRWGPNPEQSQQRTGAVRYSSFQQPPAPVPERSLSPPPFIRPTRGEETATPLLQPQQRENPSSGHEQPESNEGEGLSSSGERRPSAGGEQQPSMTRNQPSIWGQGKGPPWGRGQWSGRSRGQWSPRGRGQPLPPSMGSAQGSGEQSLSGGTQKPASSEETTYVPPHKRQGRGGGGEENLRGGMGDLSDSSNPSSWDDQESPKDPYDTSGQDRSLPLRDEAQDDFHLRGGTGLPSPDSPLSEYEYSRKPFEGLVDPQPSSTKTKAPLKSSKPSIDDPKAVETQKSDSPATKDPSPANPGDPELQWRRDKPEEEWSKDPKYYSGLNWWEETHPEVPPEYRKSLNEAFSKTGAWDYGPLAKDTRMMEKDTKSVAHSYGSMISEEMASTWWHDWGAQVFGQWQEHKHLWEKTRDPRAGQDAVKWGRKAAQSIGGFVNGTGAELVHRLGRMMAVPATDQACYHIRNEIYRRRAKALTDEERDVYWPGEWSAGSTWAPRRWKDPDEFAWEVGSNDSFDRKWGYIG